MPKFLIIPILILLTHIALAQLPDSKLAADVRGTVWPALVKEMQFKKLTPGNPVFIRIFKDQHTLEIWVQQDKQYSLFKTYPVCYFSGGLGTKTRENDGKSPEGFYNIEPSQLNPVSKYHLAINVGYPNALEKLRGNTGNYVMIHGHCVSIGCYAMTDPLIDEIFTIVYKSLQAGQKSIPLAIFPFRLKDDYLNNMTSSTDYNLWKNMQQGYNLFEKNHIPPTVYIAHKQYAFK